MFVRETFTVDSKARIFLLVDLSRMDDQTRAAAIDKVGVYALFGVGLYVY